MKKMFYPLCSLFLFLSCSKDSQQSKAALLVTSNWKIIADSISPGRVFSGPEAETDMYARYDPCELDVYFSFKSDGAYELNNGSQKCDPADPQKIQGTWFFSDNDTKLNLSPYNNYLFSVCNIQELTTARMKLVRYTKEPNGTITRTHYITLIH
jgi:hypothetical protein